MKTGIILYVAGNAPCKWAEEDENTIRNTLNKTEPVEIITSKTGHYDIHDAWWSLLTKGVNHITCKLAFFDESGEFTFTDKELRLCG